jgi:hypothetical protein
LRTKETIPHAAEKACVARRRFAFSLEVADAGIRSLERLILYQHRLNERIRGVGSLSQAIPDQAFGLGITLRVLESGEAVE